jgi:hypothetical protein
MKVDIAHKPIQVNSIQIQVKYTLEFRVDKWLIVVVVEIAIGCLIRCHPIEHQEHHIAMMVVVIRIVVVDIRTLVESMMAMSLNLCQQLQMFLQLHQGWPNISRLLESRKLAS